MAAKSLYDLLEVASSASNEAIEASFHRLIDALKPRAADGEEAAVLQMQALQEARRTLIDPARRERYDQALEARAAATRAPAEYAERPRIGGWVIAVALVALLVGGGGWYSAHKSRVEQQRAELALREKAAALARLNAEKEKAREGRFADAAERATAREERNEELRYQRWVEQNRRDGDRIQRQNAYAEKRAQAELAREEQRVETEKVRAARQIEIEKQRKDAVAMRRLEEEKRRLRQLQRQNRSSY